MPTSTIILRDHKAMPWPNGAGITYEVTRSPESGDFDWRISLADIDNDGPFSVMPGIDRVVVLMEGGHMVLTEDGTPHSVAELEVFAFAGERSFDCTLPEGPARDLNIMTRRGRVEADVQVLHAGAHAIPADGHTHVLVALRGATEVDEHALAYRDAAVIRDGGSASTDGAFAHITLRSS